MTEITAQQVEEIIQLLDEMIDKLEEIMCVLGGIRDSL